MIFIDLVRPMAARQIKSMEIHYLMLQFLILILFGYVIPELHRKISKYEILNKKLHTALTRAILSSVSVSCAFVQLEAKELKCWWCCASSWRVLKYLIYILLAETVT